MRIPKNQARNQTVKAEGLTVPEKGQDDIEAEDGPPSGLFDPDDFDIDFMDMMPFAQQYNPYYPGDLYSYPQMQGQYSSMSYGDEDEHEINASSSPDSVQDANDQDPENMSDSSKVNQDPNEPAVEQVKPTKKYSLNVKVKPPDALPLLQDHGLISSNSDDEMSHPSYSELLDSISARSKSRDTGRMVPVEYKVSEVENKINLDISSERTINPNITQDPILFMHDYAFPVSPRKGPSPVGNMLTQPVNSSVSMEDSTQLKPSTSYTVPQGTIVLPDGTILIPTTSNNTSQTAVNLSKPLPESTMNLNSKNSDSNPVGFASSVHVTDDNLVIAPNQLPAKLRLGKRQQANVSEVVLRASDIPETRLVPDSLSKVMKLEVEQPVLDLGPATPTSSSTQVSNEYDTRLIEADQSAMDFQDTFIGQPSRGHVILKTKNDRGSKRSKAKAISKTSGAEDIESTTDVVVRSSRKPKVTPVSTITDIVGLSGSDEKGGLLKEASSKPIKHRTDIDNVESAKERSVKNAINARVNRQKHKVYVQTLEEENAGLKDETRTLQHKNEILQQEKDLLNKEIVYLKKVIANESSLANVLSGLSNLKDVRLTSDFANSFRQVRKESADSSADAVSVQKTIREGGIDASQRNSMTGGVCIHVSGENASLELCQKCAEMASHAME